MNQITVFQESLGFSLNKIDPRCLNEDVGDIPFHFFLDRISDAESI